MRIKVEGGRGMGRSLYLKVRDRIVSLLEKAAYEMTDTGFGIHGMDLIAYGNLPLQPRLVGAIGKVAQEEGLEFGPAPKHIRIVAEPGSRN